MNILTKALPKVQFEPKCKMLTSTKQKFIGQKGPLYVERQTWTGQMVYSMNSL